MGSLSGVQDAGTTAPTSTAAPSMFGTNFTASSSPTSTAAPTMFGTQANGSFGLTPGMSGGLGGLLNTASQGQPITSSWQTPTPVYSDQQIQSRYNQGIGDAASQVAGDRRYSALPGISGASTGRQFVGAAQGANDWASGIGAAQQGKIADQATNANSMFAQQTGQLDDVLGQLGASQQGMQYGQNYQNQAQQMLMQSLLGQGRAITSNTNQGINYAQGQGDVGLGYQQLGTQNLVNQSNAMPTYNNSLQSVLGLLG